MFSLLVVQYLFGCEVALFDGDILAHSLVHSAGDAARWERGWVVLVMVGFGLVFG